MRKGGCNAPAHPSLVRKHQALIEQSASCSEVASVQGQLAQMTKDDEPESILLPARHLQSLLVERCRRVPVALEFRDLAKEAKDPLPRPVLRAVRGVRWESETFFHGVACPVEVPLVHANLRDVAERYGEETAVVLLAGDSHRFFKERMRPRSIPPPQQQEAPLAQRLDFTRVWRRPRKQVIQPLVALYTIPAIPEARAGERRGQLQARLEIGRLEQTRL